MFVINQSITQSISQSDNRIKYHNNVKTICRNKKILKCRRHLMIYLITCSSNIKSYGTQSKKKSLTYRTINQPEAKTKLSEIHNFYKFDPHRNILDSQTQIWNTQHESTRPTRSYISTLVETCRDKSFNKSSKSLFWSVL